MFQFAFGLAAGARLGTDFAMNDELLRPAFRLGPWTSARRRPGRAARFRATKRLAPLSVVKVDNEADPRVALEALVDGRHYAGFFQSLDFFANVQTDVRAAFEPRAHHVEAFTPDTPSSRTLLMYAATYAEPTTSAAVGSFRSRTTATVCGWLATTVT